jgi:hypothetical protein
LPPDGKLVFVGQEFFGVMEGISSGLAVVEMGWGDPFRIPPSITAKQRRKEDRAARYRPSRVKLPNLAELLRVSHG